MLGYLAYRGVRSATRSHQQHQSQQQRQQPRKQQILVGPSSSWPRQHRETRKERQEQVERVERRAAKIASDVEVLREQLKQKAPVENLGREVKCVPSVGTEDPTTPVVGDRNKPTDLDDIVGQESIVQQLRLVAMAALMRGEKIPNILVEGGSGMGKSSLASLVADLVGAEMISINGSQLKRGDDLVGLILKTGERPCVLYLDECHSCSKVALESLYTLMTEGRLEVINGTGNDTAAYSHPVPNVTVVAATNRAGLLSAPFLNRFGLRLTMEPYSDDDLALIVSRSWTRDGLDFDPEEAMAVARASKNTPRTALHLGARVRDWVTIEGRERISLGTVASALDTFNIDPNGMTDLDRRIIQALTEVFPGRAVGLTNLAGFLDVDPKSISENAEGWLCRAGYLIKTGQGRMATAKAYDLMNGRREFLTPHRQTSNPS